MKITENIRRSVNNNTRVGSIKFKNSLILGIYSNHNIKPNHVNPSNVNIWI